MHSGQVHEWKASVMHWAVKAVQCSLTVFILEKNKKEIENTKQHQGAQPFSVFLIWEGVCVGRHQRWTNYSFNILSIHLSILLSTLSCIWVKKSQLLSSFISFSSTKLRGDYWTALLFRIYWKRKLEFSIEFTVTSASHSSQSV